jgi:hypothetical protein
MARVREEAADRIELRILVQDPVSTPRPVTVRVRGHVRAGPIGDRIAVFDYNRDRDVVFSAARPRRDGSFPRYDVEDVRFHQLNAYGIAARATELVEKELGRPLRWGFDGSRLLVVPHAGTLANAFYSTQTHSLQFYSFVRARGRVVYHTALAHDVVAHETGHALLDAVRPRYGEAFEPETAALHEAIGDLTAVFAALSHRIVRRRVARNLAGANLLSEIAEGFEEEGATGWASLRSLVDARPLMWKDTIESHDLSLRLSSAVYRCLERLTREIRARGHTQEDALRQARTLLQRMVVRALDYLPPADATLDDFAQAMLVADHVAKPKDERDYRAVVRRVLVERGLVPARFEPAPDPASWRDYPRSWPRVSPRDAYLFLDANRDRLALAPHPAERDFVVRDVQVKRPPDGPGEVDQVVLLYEYPVDVELREPALAYLARKWITLRGGGTVVFDAAGRLVHHAVKPVTRERVQRALAFLRSGAGSFVTVVEPTLDDEIRRTAARRPWLADVSADRVQVRTNLAASCGRGGTRARAGRRRR